MRPEVQLFPKMKHKVKRRKWCDGLIAALLASYQHHPALSLLKPAKPAIKRSRSSRP
jgi:hypothetical protein